MQFSHTHNSLWKPIKGPVQDWPLALCRSDSLNLDTEVEACDLVYAQYVVENRQVYHSDKQQWFYLSHQMPNEAWLFLQADTNSDSKPSRQLTHLHSTQMFAQIY